MSFTLPYIPSLIPIFPTEPNPVPAPQAAAEEAEGAIPDGGMQPPAPLVFLPPLALYIPLANIIDDLIEAGPLQAMPAGQLVPNAEHAAPAVADENAQDETSSVRRCLLGELRGVGNPNRTYDDENDPDGGGMAS